MTQNYLHNLDSLLYKNHSKNPRKRRNISFTEKTILWERNKSHVCHICRQKIHSLTEAEVDHVRANSKGGQTVSWAHRHCNRMKGNKPLSVIHKRLGIKTKIKHRRTTHKRKTSGQTWINPMTGKKEKFSPFEI